MLKNRLIPVLIHKDGMIVQSIQFRHTNVIGDAITAVEFFNIWAGDEIILLDVTRERGERDKFMEIISALSTKCFVPLTVGGWVDSLDDISDILKNGADKIVINTGAFEHPDLISSSAERFGSQCIVVSIDAKKNNLGQYEVFIDRGRKNTGVGPGEWAKQAEERGAGEIFITSIDHDGMGEGYDLELVREICGATTIPVIASGGVREWQHLVDGIRKGNAHAVAAANIFHYMDQSLRKAKKYMLESGIDMRQ